MLSVQKTGQEKLTLPTSQVLYFQPHSPCQLEWKADGCPSQRSLLAAAASLGLVFHFLGHICQN